MAVIPAIIMPAAIGFHVPGKTLTGSADIEADESVGVVVITVCYQMQTSGISFPMPACSSTVYYRGLDKSGEFIYAA